MSLNVSIPFTVKARNLTPGDRLKATAFVCVSDDDPNPGTFHFNEKPVDPNGEIAWSVAWWGISQYATTGLPYVIRVLVWRAPTETAITDNRGNRLCLSFDVWEPYQPEPCQQ